jgi:hypothetical protein
MLGNSSIQQKFATYLAIDVAEVNTALKLRTKLLADMDWLDEVFKLNFQ